MNRAILTALAVCTLALAACDKPSSTEAKPDDPASKNATRAGSASALKVIPAPWCINHAVAADGSVLVVVEVPLLASTTTTAGLLGAHVSPARGRARAGAP